MGSSVFNLLPLKKCAVTDVLRVVAMFALM
jgi:hypothetical protein